MYGKDEGGGKRGIGGVTGAVAGSSSSSLRIEEPDTPIIGIPLASHNQTLTRGSQRSSDTSGATAGAA